MMGGSDWGLLVHVHNCLSSGEFWGGKQNLKILTLDFQEFTGGRIWCRWSLAMGVNCRRQVFKFLDGDCVV